MNAADNTDVKAGLDRWRLALECTGDGLWDWDARSNKIFFSPEWRSMLGYDEEDIGDNLDEWKSRVHPEDLGPCLQALEQHLAGETESYQSEHRMLCKDGSWKWILNRGRVVLRDENGNPQRVVGLHTDISERRRIQAERDQALRDLAKEKQILEAMVTATTAGVWDWNIPDNTEYMSPRFKEMFGYQDHELPNVPESWQELVFEEDLPIALENFEKHITTRGEHPFFQTVRYRHKDGSTVHVICAGKVIEWSPEGQPVRMVGCHVDVTEQLRMQDQLRHLFAHAPVGIALNDFDTGQFIEFNDALISCLGYSGEQLQGLRHRDLTPPEFWEKDDRMLQELHRSGRFGPEEKELIGADRQTIQVSVAGFKASDTEGRPMIWSLVEDISRRKQQERQMEAAKAAAESANAAKSAFLAAMSHEIRTPLNGIIGATELLKGSSLEAAQEELVQVITSSGNALMGVINDVLDYSKIEAGELELERRAFSLLPCLEQVLDVLSSPAQSKGLGLGLVLTSPIPESIVGDETRLRQVLINLAGNAVKFTDSGEVRLEVGMDDPRHLAIAIVDTGIGISAEQQRLLFKPFRQGDSSTARHYGGSGLGLVICKRLLGMMGSDIALESKLGAGSRFSFEIPLHAEATQPTMPLRGYKVIVAGAEDLDLTVVQSALKAAGASVAVEDHSALELSLRADEPLPWDAVVLGQKANPGLSRQPFGAEKFIRLRSRSQLSRGSCVHLGPLKLSRLIDLVRQSKVSNQPGENSSEALSREFQPIRVLLADDHPVNMRVVELLLKRLHVSEIQTVVNGAEAEESCRQSTFDLVLMDCQMPVMDGYEATKRIRQHFSQREHARPLIVALSADALDSDRERALAAGMDAYLTKPVRIERLQEVLDHAREKAERPAG